MVHCISTRTSKDDMGLIMTHIDHQDMFTFLRPPPVHGPFRGSLNIYQGSFRGSLYIYQGSFRGPLNIYQGSFRGSLNIYQGSFRGSLNIYQGSFRGSLNIYQGSFRGSLYIYHGTSEGRCTFELSWFLYEHTSSVMMTSVWLGLTSDVIGHIQGTRKLQ